MSNGRLWSPDDTAKLRRLVAAGWTDSHIAEEMGRERTLIVKKRTKHNIEPGQSRAMSAMMARINLQRRMARA